jgi:hypothetical protein
MEVTLRDGSRPSDEYGLAVLHSDGCNNISCCSIAIQKIDINKPLTKDNAHLICCGLAQLYNLGIPENTASAIFEDMQKHIEQDPDADIGPFYAKAMFAKIEQFKAKNIVHDLTSIPSKKFIHRSPDYRAAFEYQKKFLTDDQRAKLTKIVDVDDQILVLAMLSNAFNACCALDKDKLQELVQKYT